MSALLKVVPTEPDIERLAAIRNEQATLAQRMAMHLKHMERARAEWTALGDEGRELEEGFERRRRARLRDELPVMAAPIRIELVEGMGC